MRISLPDGSSVRPGKVLCIGRNYAAHVREMGDVADLPTEPVVFLKPSTALVPDGAAIVLPKQSRDVHHEVEVVLVIGKGGKNVAEADAMEHVAAYALGLDMTARDVQKRAKDARGPWSIAKGFDTFAPLGPLTPASEVSDPANLTIRLTVNGETRQEGHTSHLLFPFPFLVSYLSRVFTLEPGDLIYTGTPEGVGPVREGDRLVATAEGAGGRIAPLRVHVEAS